MRRFAEFDAQAGDATVQRAEVARVRSLATWAYLWLVPGFCFVRQRSNFIQGWRAAAAAGASLAEGDSAGAVGLQGVPPLGSWMMLPDLTTPATQTVLPSNDALYGASHVELDLLGPVVVSVPGNPDGRYYSVAIMDAMLTNVGHIGPKWTGNGPSDHVIVPPGWAGETPAGMPVVAAPTASICLYHRVLVDYGDGDLEHVRQWMRGVRITQLSKWGEPGTAPDDVPTAAFEHGDLGSLTDPWEYFRIGFAHLRHNPPPQQGAWLHALLHAPELTGEPPDESLRQAVLDGVADAQDLMDATLTTWPRRNGWMVPKPYLGLPGPHVLEAAAFQLFQIGSNDIAESAYFFDDTDADGQALDGSDGARYELRFARDELPELEEAGYWSLTMYDAFTNLLVANPIHRYATRTTRPGFVTGPDGSVTISLAADLPPDTPEANWLPAPDGRFRLGVRAYYPGEAIRAAEWVPPAVRRVR
jgi:hypothetical protein